MNKLPIELLEIICLNLNYRSNCHLKRTNKYISSCIDINKYIYRSNSKMLFYHWIANGYVKQLNEIYKPCSNLSFTLKDNKNIIEQVDFIRSKNNMKNDFALMKINKINIQLKEIKVKTKQEAVRHIRNLLIANFTPCNDFY